MRWMVWCVSVWLPVTAAAQDNCPTDPAKTEPGLCGCGVADSDWDEDGAADSCIDPLATVSAEASIGWMARVDADAEVLAYASLAEGAWVGSDAVVAPRARVDAAAVVEPGAIVGRNAHIGAQAVVGADSTVGRSASWGARVRSGARASVGYASVLGADTVLGSDVVVGSLVTLGERDVIGDRVVLARGVALGDDVRIGADSVVGPDVGFGAGSVVGTGVRIRKGGRFGANAWIGDGARIGRDIDVGEGAWIGAGATIRSVVTGGDFVMVDDAVYIERGAVLPTGTAPPVFHSVEGPADWRFGPEQRTLVSARATDPADRPISWSWSFVGDATGWVLEDADLADARITPPGPDGTPRVTVRVVADNGVRQTTVTRELELHVESDCAGWIDPLRAWPGRDIGDGLYWVSPSGDLAQSQQVWCDQSLAGGGWMLVSSRPGDSSRDNVEDCGSDTDAFFTQGCGTAVPASADTSYAMSQAARAAHDPSAWMVVPYIGGVADQDDVVVLHTVTDILSPSATLVDRPIDRACSLDGECDHGEVVFRYAGTGSIADAGCTLSASGSHSGAYGLCHVGTGGSVAPYGLGSLFGNRSGADESKVWGQSGPSDAVTERIYLRTGPAVPATGQPPVLTGLSAPDEVDGGATTGMSASATDPDSSTFTWRWRFLTPASGWALSSATSSSASITAPANATPARVTVEVTVSDDDGNLDNDVFEVTAVSVPRSCKDLYAAGVRSTGLHTVYPTGGSGTLQVYCDMANHGGGWTLVYRNPSGQGSFTAGTGASGSAGSTSYKMSDSNINTLRTSPGAEGVFRVTNNTANLWFRSTSPLTWQNRNSGSGWQASRQYGPYSWVGPCGHPNQSYVFGVKTGSNGVCVSSNSEKYMYTDGFRWNTEGGAFWSGSPGTYDSLWVR